jgi:sec-independent protein translocase protein TatA
VSVFPKQAQRSIMGFDSLWHWIILLVIVLVLFGTKKIRHLGSDLGAAVRDFKKGVSGDEDATQKDAAAQKEAEAQRKAAEQLRADAPPADGASTTQSQRDSSETK